MFSVRRLEYAVFLFGLGLFIPLGAGCGSSGSGSPPITEERLKEEQEKNKAVAEHFKEYQATHAQAAPSGSPAEALRLRRGGGR